MSGRALSYPTGSTLEEAPVALSDVRMATLDYIPVEYLPDFLVVAQRQVFQWHKFSAKLVHFLQHQFSPAYGHDQYLPDRL